MGSFSSDLTTNSLTTNNLLLLSLLLLALAGCSAARPPLPPLPDVSAAELQTRLAQRQEAIRALRSEATIAVSSPERSGTARQFLIAARPDRLRIEVFSPFGTVFALTTADGDLAAWVREENRVYRGDASPRNLSRWAGIDLAVADVVDVVLGGPPARRVESATVYPERATQRLRLRQETVDGAQVVAFAADTLLPAAIEELDADGVLLWRATFTGYREAGGVALATRIGIELPQAQQSVDITLSDPELNPALPATLFALPTPPGATIAPL